MPKALRFNDKEGVLSHRWRFPTLSIHGVEGAWAGAGEWGEAHQWLDIRVCRRYLVAIHPALMFFLCALPLFCAGAKTVIPHTVIGKFSLRLVPDQGPAYIEAKIRAHLESEFAKLGSPNTMEISMGHGAKAWLSSYDSPNYVAGEAHGSFQ